MVNLNFKIGREIKKEKKKTHTARTCTTFSTSLILLIIPLKKINK